MSDVMIDIETLSTKPNAAMLSVGAAFFNIQGNRLGRHYYANIEMSSYSSDYHIDPDTVKWWFTQSQEARDAVLVKPQPIKKVLMELGAFMRQGGSSLRVWGNGANFDPVILRNAYETENIPVPWKFWNTRDVRTVVDQMPNIKNIIKREGTYHNALDDAITQAKWILHILNS